MILTLTPNPALDVTYDVSDLVPHASHRVLGVREMAGGKGINVASVLALNGVGVLATGPIGGVAGVRLRADLETRGIRHDLVETAEETRRTVTVVSAADGEATAFNEPGPALRRGDWHRLVQRTADLLSTHDIQVLVGSGSVPPGFPEDGYGQVTRLAHSAGCVVVVDASRGALRGALAAAPDVVKPNRHELAEVARTDDPVAGARVLQAWGARDVLVSLGPEGMMLVTRDGDVVRASLAQPLRGNPTGAGDACVAAVVAGLGAGAGWERILVDAVAWSAAAVLQQVAGVVDLRDVARLAGDVSVWRS